MSKHNPILAIKENHINQRERWAEITTVFGERLLQLRKVHKLAQRAFAAQLGVSQACINRYEHGQDKPGYEKLVQLAQLLASRPIFCWD